MIPLVLFDNREASGSIIKCNDFDEEIYEARQRSEPNNDHSLDIRYGKININPSLFFSIIIGLEFSDFNIFLGLDPGLAFIVRQFGFAFEILIGGKGRLGRRRGILANLCVDTFVQFFQPIRFNLVLNIAFKMFLVLGVILLLRYKIHTHNPMTWLVFINGPTQEKQSLRCTRNVLLRRDIPCIRQRGRP
jgi:hypothetical protein